VAEVARLQPAGLVVVADGPGRSLVPFLQALRAAGSTTKIILLGDEDTLDRDDMVMFWSLISAHLMWSNVRAETVPRCLHTVVEDDLVVGSRAVQEMYLNPPERWQRPRERTITLTERQRVVLKGLGDGLGPCEIADIACFSERTVDRGIAHCGIR